MLILFGILIETKDSKTEKPVFVNIIDNSSSMLNYKDSSEVISRINKYNQTLRQKQNNRFEIVNYVVDSDVRVDSLDFKGSITNLNSGFDYVYNQFYNKNVGGICLISDGNYNEGQNPIFTAEKISLTPVFTLGVGDTLVKRDQVLKSVSANQVAFLGNEFPIEIDVEAIQYEGERSKIQIIQGGKVIKEQEITYSQDDIDFKHLTVMMQASSIGFANYIIKVVSLEGESTLQNNSRSIFVEILNSRSKILFLASSPHPDVTVIKQVLETDEKIEVDTKLIKDWDGELKDYQMIVLHGLNNARSQELSTKIKNDKKPVLYIVDNESKKSDVETFGVDLTIPNSPSLDEVQGAVRSEFQLFELSEDLSRMLIKAPPLHVRFGKVSTKSGKVLITQRIGPVNKVDPIVFFGKNSVGKYGVLNGEGFWRWKLSEYANTKDNKGFNEFIQKSMQYLLVRSNKEPLRVNFPQRFNVNDAVEIGAEFYNESMDPIIKPDIKFQVIDDQDRKLNYEFAKRTVDYNLNIGKLKSGKYRWSAKTSYGGKQFIKAGEFIVEDINIEAIATASDFGLLNQISQKTDGKFHNLKNYNNLIDEISNRKDIVNVTYEESNFNELIDLLWLFVFVILSLALEWFIRRYYGTY